MFMLGCAFIEVLTGCSRQPYDWLTEDDPSSVALLVYRSQESTRDLDPLIGAVTADRAYAWTVHTTTSRDDALLADLVVVVDGCVNADPARRWPLTRVFDALTRLLGEVGRRDTGRLGAPSESASASASASLYLVPPSAAPAAGMRQQPERAPLPPPAPDSAAAPPARAHGRRPTPAPTSLDDGLHSATPVTASASSPSYYDVLDIVGAMEGLRMRVDRVVDAIGGVTAAPLDALTAAGLSFVDTMAVKRALSSSVPVPRARVVPAQVLP